MSTMNGQIGMCTPLHFSRRVTVIVQSTVNAVVRFMIQTNIFCPEIINDQNYTE